MTLLIENIEYFECEVTDWIADKVTDGKTHQDIIDEHFDECSSLVSQASDTYYEFNNEPQCK